MKKLASTNLGEVLRLSGVVDKAAIETAVETQRQLPMPIGEALVRTGAATPEDVDEALAMQSRLRSRDSKVAGKAAAELLARAAAKHEAQTAAITEPPPAEPEEETRPEPVVPGRSR